MIKTITSYILPMAMFALCFEAAFSQDIWTPQNSGTSNTLYRVQFVDTEIGYAVGDEGMVVKTTDGGSNWMSVPVQTGYPVRDLSFVDGTTGWVATGDTDNSMVSGSVWKTADGGANWEEQPLGTDQARLGISFVSTTHGWACGANNGPWDIRATTDGGSSWHGQSGSGFGWIYDIDCISTTTGWSVGVVYYPSSSGFVIKTTDGGGNWFQQNTGVVPFLYGVQFVDSDYGYAVGDAGTVLGTTDGGTGWSDLDAGTSANLADLSFISSSTGWVCGTGGTVLMTSDAGSTWEDLPTGMNLTFRGASFVDSSNGWIVGDDGVILKYNPETTGINDNELSQPKGLELNGNYPNPFNAATTISFSLSERSSIELSIYDILGQRVVTLVKGEQDAGEHSVVWSASDLPSGIYFAGLKAAGQIKTGRMALLK